MRDNPSYESTSAVAIVADPGASDRLTAVAVAAGARVLARIDWDSLASQTEIVCDVIAAEAAGVPIDRLATALPMLEAISRRAGAAIVITFDEAQIDVVAGAMLGTGAALLCAPDALTCAGAIALAGGVLRHDAVREGEAERLDRLNAEVARIADMLARLARGGTVESNASSIVGDRSLGYGAQPSPTGSARAVDVRAAIRVRRLRDSLFGAGLFEDPAWDMLLDLFAAERERAQVSVSSLCIAAAVAPTTALRWISRLVDAGLLIREPDAFDRRRAFMALSPRASAAMHEYWAAAIRAGAAIG